MDECDLVAQPVAERVERGDGVDDALVQELAVDEAEPMFDLVIAFGLPDAGVLDEGDVVVELDANEDGDADPERLTNELTLSDRVNDGDGVAEMDGVAEAVAADEREPRRYAFADTVDDENSEVENVGRRLVVTDTVEEPQLVGDDDGVLGVIDAVAVKTTLRDGYAEGVFAPDESLYSDGEEVDEDDAFAVVDAEGERVGRAEPVVDAEIDGERDASADREGVVENRAAVADTAHDIDEVVDPEGVCDATDVTLLVAVSVDDAGTIDDDAETERVQPRENELNGDRDALRVAARSIDGETDVVLEGTFEASGDPDSVRDARGEDECDGDAVLDCVVDIVSDRRPLRDDDAVGRREGVIRSEREFELVVVGEADGRGDGDTLLDGFAEREIVGDGVSAKVNLDVGDSVFVTENVRVKSELRD